MIHTEVIVKHDLKGKMCRRRGLRTEASNTQLSDARKTIESDIERSVSEVGEISIAAAAAAAKSL